MVKLSVICQQEQADQIIPKISEYSNSQNKVASSAFSIRHPFHLKIEEFSRKTYALATGDSQESLWYYERVQGQYKNAINLRHTKTERNVFESQNPKRQMFKSVDLAKYILSFDSMPNIVCLGSQKCYANFAKSYLKTDEKTGEGVVGPEINQDYYKELCCKALLFKALEERVSKGVRFVIVPYTIAVIMNNLKQMDLNFNYQLIWNKQWDNEILFSAIASYSADVYKAIADSMPDSISIFSEWGKRSDCWKIVSDLKLNISPILEYTVNNSEYISEKNESKKNAAVDLGIEAQTYVVTKSASYWKSLISWIRKGNMPISQKEASILDWAAQIPYKIPSPKQCSVIISIERRAIETGFYE